MKKIATKLTPKVKEFIRETFKSDYYNDKFVSENDVFHYPNVKDFNGFCKGEHCFFCLKEGYEEVSEQEFLDYFKEEDPLIYDLTKAQNIPKGFRTVPNIELPDLPDDILFKKEISIKPSHYSQTKSGMDVFDVARDWNIKEPEHFSALKYVLRLGKKDEATKEIDKAIDCLKRLKEVYNAG